MSKKTVMKDAAGRLRPHKAGSLSRGGRASSCRKEGRLGGWERTKVQLGRRLRKNFPVRMK